MLKLRKRGSKTACSVADRVVREDDHFRRVEIVVVVSVVPCKLGDEITREVRVGVNSGDFPHHFASAFFLYRFIVGDCKRHGEDCHDFESILIQSLARKDQVGFARAGNLILDGSSFEKVHDVTFPPALKAIEGTVYACFAKPLGQQVAEGFDFDLKAYSVLLELLGIEFAGGKLELLSGIRFGRHVWLGHNLEHALCALLVENDCLTDA